MTKILLLGICFMGFANNVFADADILSCSKFLPDDHSYQVVIKYDIKRNKAPKRFVGITDSDSRDLTSEQAVKIKPFVDCIKEKVEKN